MTPVFASILVPLDGSRLAALSLGCAIWLATRLGARLHILSATPRTRPAHEELQRLLVPEEHWPLVTLHQVPAYPEDAILVALAHHGIELVVMSAYGQTAEARVAAEPDPDRALGHVARAVVARSPAPVLLLPPSYREALPWERLLVPLSGEAEADRILGLAVRVADTLGLEVHVAHVAGEDAGHCGLEATARYADALHHEYPNRLDELVSRSAPGSTRDERRRIKDVALGRGDIAAELLGLAERKRVSALVAGWHGRLSSGHARVLKRLIHRIESPVLLVRAAARVPFRLAVGAEIE
jgi:nucleotide-binding universal stress UspA family protein